jgi:NADH-quinone oxidoreductase subunit H
MTVGFVLAALAKILLMVLFLANVGGLLTWVDRRLSSMIQDRVGPNRAVVKLGKFELRAFGLLHTAADGVKFFFKEDFIPPKADRLLYHLSPNLGMVALFMVAAVIPFGDVVCTDSLILKGIDGALVFPSLPRSGVCSAGPSGIGAIPMQIATLSVGILFIFAMSGASVVSAAIAGWSSDNKFSLLGGLRAASQMVSYEVALGMSLIGCFMIYGDLRLDEMVRWQGAHTWGIFVQPLAFFLFFTAAVAETKRIPFDLPEAEPELVSGYFTEYAGMKFGMFYFVEYMEIVTSSMLLVTFFLGGWQLPFFHRDGLDLAIGSWQLAYVPLSHLAITVLQVLTFFGKTIAVCLLQAFVRWTLPRFRYDQLMRLCWKTLLPLALANIFATGIIYMALDTLGDAVKAPLQIVADCTQALVAVLITFGVLRALVAFLLPSKHKRWLVGTSAATAARSGGSGDRRPVQA